MLNLARIFLMYILNLVKKPTNPISRWRIFDKRIVITLFACLTTETALQVLMLHKDENLSEYTVRLYTFYGELQLVGDLYNWHHQLKNLTFCQFLWLLIFVYDFLALSSKISPLEEKNLNTTMVGLAPSNGVKYIIFYFNIA